MTNRNPSRREFLLVGCGAALGMVAVCSGLGLLAAQTPEPIYIDRHMEGEPAMKTILVTYATRAGSTVEVADAIGQTLSASGATVDVKPIKGVTSPGGYDAVVIGSAIRMGSWLPEAVDYIKKNQTVLNRMPTAFFTVHVLNRDDSEASRQARLAYTAAVRALVTPKAETFFAGKMDYAKLSFLDRMIAQAVAKSTNSAEGDYRDWVGIRNWAGGLEHTLGVTAG